METINFNLSEEAKVSNSGGLAANKCEGKLTEIALTSQWSKNGFDRTKNGTGALGVNTTLGWLNASMLITYLMKLDGENPVRVMLIEEETEEKKVGNKKVQVPTGNGTLNIDDTNVFFMKTDSNGSITEVSLEEGEEEE